MTGSFTDSLRSRFGRRHGFMYAAALPMALTFYSVFNPPAGLDESGLLAWMLLWVVLARAAMTLYHVPHLALGAELSEDYDERTRIVAYRNFFGFVGAATLFAVAYGVFMQPTPEFESGQLNPAAYLIAGGSMLADVADEHELETGRRQEGVFFGALSFSGKSAAGIGNWVAGLGLAAIAFPLQAAPGEVAARTVTQLALIYGPGMLLLMAVGIVVLARYSLTRERHVEIRSALAQRRSRRPVERPLGAPVARAPQAATLTAPRES